MGHRNEFDSFRDLFLTNESSDLLLEEAPRLCIFIRSMRFSFVCLGFFVRGWFGFSIVLSRRKDSKWAPTNKFTRLYWVWLSVTGFYWVLLGFTGFYRVLRYTPGVWVCECFNGRACAESFCVERWSCRGQSSKRKHPRPHRVLKIIFEKNSFVVVVVFTELFFSLFLLLLLLVLSLSFGSFFLCLLGFLPVFFFLCFPLLLVSGRSYRVFFSLIFFATKKKLPSHRSASTCFSSWKVECESRSFTEFYRVLPSFTEFYHLFFITHPTGLYSLFLDKSQVGDSFIEFYWVLPSFTGFDWVLPGFYRVLPSFDSVLPSLIGFYLVLLDFKGFYRVLRSFDSVLPSFLGFYWVLPGLTEFYRV